MSGRAYIQRLADEARAQNPNLITGDELMRRMVEAKAAERAALVAEQQLAEITRLREAAEKIAKSLEEG